MRVRLVKEAVECAKREGSYFITSNRPWVTTSHLRSLAKKVNQQGRVSVKKRLKLDAALEET